MKRARIGRRGSSPALSAFGSGPGCSTRALLLSKAARGQPWVHADDAPDAGSGAPLLYAKIDTAGLSGQGEFGYRRENIVNRTTAPNGASSSVRFVRARLRNEGVPCVAVPFRPIMSLEAFNVLRIDMPSFAAVVPAQPLGCLSPARRDQAICI